MAQDQDHQDPNQDQTPPKTDSAHEPPGSGGNGGYTNGADADAGEGFAQANGSAGSLQTNFTDVDRYMAAINPDGHVHVMAFKFVGKGSIREGKLFPPNAAAARNAWIRHHQDLGKNIYNEINGPKPDLTPSAARKKLSKTDIAWLRNVAVDIDIIVKGQAERAEALEKVLRIVLDAADDPFLRCKAALIVVSGNGVHVYYILAQPLSATAENINKTERAGRGLKAYFRKLIPADIAKVDGVWDAARLLRTAGTVNHPDDDKAAMGAVPCLSWIAYETKDRVTVEDLLRDFPAPAGGGSVSVSDAELKAVMDEMETEMVLGLDEADPKSLPDWLKEKLERAAKADSGLEKLWRGGTGRSGSENVFGLACAIRRAWEERFTAEEFAGLARVWPHTYGNKPEENATIRAFARAWINADYEAPSAWDVFDEVDENDPEVKAWVEEQLKNAAKAAGGRSSHPNWKKFYELLEELRDARDEVRVNNTDAEVFDSGTVDPKEEFDDPFVTNHHTRGEVTQVTAPPERGKSTMVVLKALAVAHEKPELLTGAYAGDPTGVTDWAGDVVLVLNENAGRARKMLKAAEEVNGLKRADMKHTVHIYPDRLVMAEMTSGNKVVPTDGALAFLRKLVEIRKKGEIALVVIDTLASAVSGLPENSTDAMQPVMDMLSDIAVAGFCAVEITHHPAKSTSTVVDAYQGRGSTAVGGAIAQTAMLERVDEDDPRRLRLVLGKMRNRAKVGDNEEFRVAVWSFEVTRARAPGQTRMSTVAAFKRMTPAEAAAEKTQKEDVEIRDAMTAIEIAIRAGTIIRPGGTKRSGLLKGGKGTWVSAWVVVQKDHDAKGGKMSASAARALIDRLEAKGMLVRSPSGEGEIFELSKEWAEKADEF
jgi:AAA domain